MDFVIDDAVGNNRALFRLATVVNSYRFQLLAKHTAGSIDLFDGGINPFFDHGAILGNRTGKGTGYGDFDGVSGSSACRDKHAGSKANGSRNGSKTNIHKAS